MLKRPLLLKLFILYLMLDPLIRSVFISIETDFPLLTVIQKTFTLRGIDIFNYWILFPLSGVLLWFVNIYSLLFFVSTQIYSLFFHINYESYDWPYLSETPSATAYVLLGLNLFIMIYLLMPSSIEIFGNKGLRWWERGSRFNINAPCFVAYSDKLIKGVVKDLSFSGAHVIADENLNPGLEFVLDFEVLNSSFKLDSKVVRSISSESRSYGIQFQFGSAFQKLKLRVLMFLIGMNGAYEKYR